MAASDRFSLLVGLILIIGAALLTGCSRQSEAPTAPAPGRPLLADLKPVQGDWVLEQIPSDPDSLNPITGQDAYGALIRYPNIFESLLVMDNSALKLKPQDAAIEANLALAYAKTGDPARALPHFGLAFNAAQPQIDAAFEWEAWQLSTATPRNLPVPFRPSRAICGLLPSRRASATTVQLIEMTSQPISSRQRATDASGCFRT